VLPSHSSSRLSNGETESVKTMIVHDEGESDAGSTPCKDSSLIVLQVLAERGNPPIISTHLLFVPKCSSILFVHRVDHLLFLHTLTESN